MRGTPRRLSRRTVLKAAGVSLALPLLEAMLPRRALAAPALPQRVAFLYIPNGVAVPEWTPTDTGRNWSLSPSLAPLAPVKDHVVAISGLDRTEAVGVQNHAQCGSCWLSSSTAQEPKDGGFPTNVSLDQLIANRIGGDTLLPSLELSCNDATDNAETRYFESISWYAPGYAANTEKNPREVFNRLFGVPQKTALTRSVLDVLLQDARALERRVGVADRRKLGEYLESVRATEKRVQRADTAAATRKQPPIGVPPGIPENRGEYIGLMTELMVLAFQQDLTRVATLLVGPERWNAPRMYHGVFDKPESHHVLSHDTTSEAQAKLALIDRFHVQLFAAMVQRMASISEGGATLLDNSLVVMGSGLGDGAAHSMKELPVLLAGHGGGAVKTGYHARFEGEQPLANLWLTVARTMGVDCERFADSTRELSELTAG